VWLASGGSREALQDGVARLKVHADHARQRFAELASEVREFAGQTAEAASLPGKQCTAEDRPQVILTVRWASGEMALHAEFAPVVTIAHVKDALLSATGIRHVAQMRVSGPCGAELTNGVTLVELGPENEMTLTLEQIPMPLNAALQMLIQWLSSSEEVDVDVMKKLCHALGVASAPDAVQQLRRMLKELSPQELDWLDGSTERTDLHISPKVCFKDSPDCGSPDFGTSVVPLQNLSASFEAFRLSHALPPAVTEVIMAVPIFFQNFIPMRAEASGALMALREAEMALELAEESLEYATKPIDSIISSSDGLTVAQLRIAQLLKETSCLMPDVLLASVQPNADPPLPPSTTHQSSEVDAASSNPAFPTQQEEAGGDDKAEAAEPRSSTPESAHPVAAEGASGADPDAVVVDDTAATAEAAEPGLFGSADDYGEEFETGTPRPAPAPDNEPAGYEFEEDS